MRLLTGLGCALGVAMFIGCSRSAQVPTADQSAPETVAFAKDGSRVFGSLAAEPARAKSNYDAGIRQAVFGVSWGRYEPEEGKFDEAYIAEVRRSIDQFKAAGLSVVLGPGLQYPPKWIRQYANSRFVNQFGEEYNEDANSGTNGVNAVFSNAVREKQAAYIRHLLTTFGEDFQAVRLGWGYYGELNLPGRAFNGKENCYWAYDDIAQGKQPGLPAGMTVCPVPGWKPGEASADHESARKFANWYMDCLKNYHDWQIETVRRVYPGPLAMMYPSWGIRPGQLEAAIAQDLNGTTPAEKNGETQRAFDFARFIAGIKDPGVVVYTTWIDTNPEYGDDNDTDPARWSQVHFLADCAAKNPLKLAVWGENTGKADMKKMQLSFDRMRQYGLIGLVWAFEKDLYDTRGKYATIEDYARMIREDHAMKAGK